MTFADGGVVIATCAQQPVTDGVASCTVTYSTARSHSVVAEYGGTSTYLSSKSAPESETVISVPSAPVGLTAGSDNGGATLTWSPPPSAGGRSVIGYDVYERTSTNSAFAGPVNGSALVAGTSVTLDGLTNGGTYYFIVEAVNEVGNSPPSNEASAQPTGSRPAPAVRGQPGGKTSVVSASPPRPGSPSADQPGAGSSLFGGATGSGGPPKGSASSQGGNGGPSGGNSSGGNPAGTSGTPSHGRHASVAAFGPKAYANDGRGPDVSYARSVGTGLYGGPPGFVPLAQAVPTPLDVSWRPAHLLKDIGLAALLILLLALPAELLNLSFRTRGEKAPPAGSAVRRLLQPVERFFGRLPAAGAFALVALAGSVLYALVDPTFGFDRSTLAEILGFVGAIGITTASLEFGRRHYLDRDITKGQPLRVFPLGVVAALILVGLSRLGHFEPGYMFGLLAVFAFAVKPTEARNGAAYAKAALWLLAICAAVWFAWIPIRHAVDSGHTGLGFLIFDSLMATTWVCGLSTIVFGFMPLRTLPGGAVFAWSKGAWAVLYGFVVFVFVATVIRPTDAAFGANRHASLVSALYPFLAFAVVAVVASTYVRLRAGSAHREIVTSQQSPPQQWGW